MNTICAFVNSDAAPIEVIHHGIWKYMPPGTHPSHTVAELVTKVYPHPDAIGEVTISVLEWDLPRIIKEGSRELCMMLALKVTQEGFHALMNGGMSHYYLG